MAASFQGPGFLAPAGSTGNVTLPAGFGYGVDPAAVAVAIQLVIESAGATPTVTLTAQGSYDGVNWYNLAYVTDATDTVAVAPVTYTTTGARILQLSLPLSRRYKYYRVASSANTNVTFRAEIYTNNPG